MRALQPRRITTDLERRGDSRKLQLLKSPVVAESSVADSERALREAHKMEAIGRLVGGVAHDFNNLLTGIMLYCDLLIEGLEGNSRLRHHAREIRMAGEQGAALIHHLLAVARQQVAQPHALSLNTVASNTRNLLVRLIGENIQLQTSLGRNLWQVRMDPAQVQQIIMNLVLNARDAMPAGGRIRISTRNTRISETQRQPFTHAVELKVEDNGSGMDAATQARLFEPFFTTKNPGQGNGLGLATVRGIVKDAGGTITVESETGKGTSIRILLPRFNEHDAGSQPAMKLSRKAGTRETILLVEDNAAVRKSARRVLTQSGYSVLEAGNGTEAIARCHAHRGHLDLLLADLVMPGMSGTEVARRLQDLQPGLRVLYMSGYDQARAERETRDPVLLFRKPFTGQALVQKVREILQSVPQPDRRGNPR